MTNPAILFAAGFALATLMGCADQSPSLTASLQPGGTRTEPIILISARGLPPQTDYLVGISTVWSPQFAARVRSDSTGSIAALPIRFDCPYVNVPPLGVGLFFSDGIAAARTTTAGVPNCDVRTPDNRGSGTVNNSGSGAVQPARG